VKDKNGIFKERINNTRKEENIQIHAEGRKKKVDIAGFLITQVRKKSGVGHGRKVDRDWS